MLSLPLVSRLLRPGGRLSRLLRPGGRLSRLLRPGGRLTCQSHLTPPLTCQSHLTPPLTCQSHPSRLCCLVCPALVGSCLIGPTWTWPSVPSPGSTSWIVLCVKRLEAALCHESGCHSLHLLHHTTAAHHLWTASPIIHCTHTFPSTITPITQLSPITN